MSHDTRSRSDGDDAGAGGPFTRASLRAAIASRFGAEARFHTCSASEMDADALIDFLARRGKFIDSGVRVPDPRRQDLQPRMIASGERGGRRRIPPPLLYFALLPLAERFCPALYGHILRCRHAVSDHGSAGQPAGLPLHPAPCRPQASTQGNAAGAVVFTGDHDGLPVRRSADPELLNLRQEAVSIAGASSSSSSPSR